MSERDVDARVEELIRGLRRMAAGLLEAAAEHPDAVRARELSAAARVLTNGVLARLDGEAVEDSPAHRSEPEVQDTVLPANNAASESGTALDELVELYLPDYARRLDKDPVMFDPDLPYERWNSLHRVRYGRGTPFDNAPLWNDAVPSRGKAVVRGMTSKAEVLRRLHHSYVIRRDLDSPEGELAVQVLEGCKAIRRSRAIVDGDFVDESDLELKLEALQWRALVIAAGRNEHARAQLLTRLRQLEVLAAAVLELDTAFRQRNSNPSLGARIAGAAHGVKTVLRHWPPKIEGAVTESGHTTP
ncbi:hypothetical protein [Streptomyces yerevanensis]|uniref:hypothetical protein n=1 Tax=Streptomyces yerevanensis TaxID=66378 RepID=UPI000524E15A|nr:hypothetical protein [Streptomyces yerevanensis]